MITALITLPIIIGRKSAGECFIVSIVKDKRIFFCSGLKIRSNVRKGFDLLKSVSRSGDVLGDVIIQKKIGFIKGKDFFSEYFLTKTMRSLFMVENINV